MGFPRMAPWQTNVVPGTAGCTVSLRTAGGCAAQAKYTVRARRGALLWPRGHRPPSDWKGKRALRFAASRRRGSLFSLFKCQNLSSCGARTGTALFFANLACRLPP